MSIYFLRHIKTDLNGADIISGRMDAEVLPGQKLSEKSEIPGKFDLVLCSSLERCVRTLELLPEEICGRIVYSEKLVERDVGVLEGMKRDDALEIYPQLFCNRKLDVNADIPNGETIGQVIERTSEIIEFLRSFDEGKNILLCSHNQTLKIIFASLKNIEITNDYWQNFNFKNGEVVNISKLKGFSEKPAELSK